MITPSMNSYVESVASISKQIKGIKDALKASEQDPFLYELDEIRYLKRKLKTLYIERKQLNSNGNGFV